jgi:hypothetical protein
MVIGGRIVLITGKTPKEVKMLGSVFIKDFNYSTQSHDKLWNGYLYTSVCKDYQFRRHKIRFIFQDAVNTTVTCDVRLAIINLIFWRPYIETNTLITPSTLFNPRKSNKNMEDVIITQMNVINDAFRHSMGIDKLCNVNTWILEQLTKISKDFCIHIGNTISMRDIIDLAIENPEFDDLIHTEYPENMKMNEIESDLNIKTARAISIINTTGTSNLHPFIRAGGNINTGQFRQCVINIGPRSDTRGIIAPMIENTNFVRGLRTVSDYYIESLSSRKALVANKTQMSSSGYASRISNLAVIDSYLVDYDDCGTTHYLTVTVNTMRSLDLLRYKYMLVGYDKGKPILHEICPEHDMHLIGQTIQVRSHVYCTLPEGTYCKTCYGGLSYYILGYYHSGLIATSSLSEPISQKVLSTKHLIITSTKTINWSDQMLSYFRCLSDSVYPLPAICTTASYLGFYNEDIDEIMSVYDKEGMFGDDDDDAEDITMTPTDYVHRFILIINGEPIDFEIPDVNLYVNDEFIYKFIKTSRSVIVKGGEQKPAYPIHDGAMFVSLEDWPSDEPIFYISIENAELGIYLKRLESLLGIKINTEYTTIEEFIKSLMDFVEEMGIEFSFAHIESILYNLVRDSNHLIRRPNFKEQNPAYTILPMSKSILMSGHLSTSLAFERIMDQLKSADTYQKSAHGFLDPFFR